MIETPQPEASGQALVERLREALTAIKSTLGDLDVEFGPRVNAAYELAGEALDALSAPSPAPASPPLDDAGYALLEELRINANRLCDRQLGGTYEQDCRRTLRKVDAYQQAAYRAGRGVQRPVQPGS